MEGPVNEVPGDDEVPGDNEVPREDEVPGDNEVPREDEVPGDNEVPREDEVPGDNEVPREDEVPGDNEVPGDDEVPQQGILSWNIWGGTADARNRLVPDVVENLDPVVLLLQETKTNRLVTLIKGAGTENGRRYKEVEAGDKKESQVLYDANIYTPINNRERLFPQDGGGEISLMQVFTESTNHEFGEEEIVQLGGGGREERARDIINDRVSIVGLKRPPRQGRRPRDFIQPPTVIFMSFHNINSVNSARVALGFIRMVTTIGDMTGCVVVAGADLNHHIEPLPPTIPGYNPTQRRHQEDVIDYFITAPPYQPRVRAFDMDEVILDDDENLDIHAFHDPLVCESPPNF